MMNLTWIQTSKELPEDGTVVETMVADAHGVRNEAHLVLKNGQWWFPDGSMYIYYVPTHWRRLG